MDRADPEPAGHRPVATTTTAWAYSPTATTAHQYDEWLLGTVANILDDDLCVSSAGLLREGAVAWVEVSVPEAITTPEGVTFRPNLLATTSFDGSIATTFKRTVTDVVCDNTRAVALAEKGQSVQGEALAALPAAPHGRAQTRWRWSTPWRTSSPPRWRSCAPSRRPITQWRKFLDAARAPLVDPQGARWRGGRDVGAAQARRAESTCTGTTRGARRGRAPRTACCSGQHLRAPRGAVRGANRAERNMLRTVTGEYGALDRATWQTLTGVLAAG